MAEVLDSGRPVMSWVNLGEVYCVTQRAVLRDLGPQLILDAASEGRVLAGAAIKPEHRLAYADALAAATAIAHEGVLLTGDPELLVQGAPWRAEDLRGHS